MLAWALDKLRCRLRNDPDGDMRYGASSLRKRWPGGSGSAAVFRAIYSGPVMGSAETSIGDKGRLAFVGWRASLSSQGRSDSPSGRLAAIKSAKAIGDKVCREMPSRCPNPRRRKRWKCFACQPPLDTLPRAQAGKGRVVLLDDIHESHKCPPSSLATISSFGCPRGSRND